MNKVNYSINKVNYLYGYAGRSGRYVQVPSRWSRCCCRWQRAVRRRCAVMSRRRLQAHLAERQATHSPGMSRWWGHRCVRTYTPRPLHTTRMPDQRHLHTNRLQYKGNSKAHRASDRQADRQTHWKLQLLQYYPNAVKITFQETGAKIDGCTTVWIIKQVICWLQIINNFIVYKNQNFLLPLKKCLDTSVVCSNFSKIHFTNRS